MLSPNSGPNTQTVGAYPAPIKVLELFKAYTRATEKSEFGVEAPSFDNTRAPKYWLDLTAPATGQTYNFLVQDTKTGVWSYQDMQLSFAEASTLNLPGYKGLVPYVNPATTNARVIDAVTGQSGPVAVSTLSAKADAQKIATELGGTLVEDNSMGGPFAINWADETRREWAVQVDDGTLLNVADLLVDRYRQGIDAPGKWTIIKGDGTVTPRPHWTPAVPGPSGFNDSRLPVPVPIRALTADEYLEPQLFGSPLLRSHNETTGGAQTLGGVDNSAQLTRIEGGINALKTLFRIP